MDDEMMRAQDEALRRMVAHASAPPMAGADGLDLALAFAALDRRLGAQEAWVQGHVLSGPYLCAADVTIDGRIVRCRRDPFHDGPHTAAFQTRPSALNNTHPSVMVDIYWRDTDR